MRHVQGNLARIDGSFSQPLDDATLVEWPYAPCWMSISAHVTGFYDLSHVSLSNALTFQDRRLGGLYGSPASRLAGDGTLVPTVGAIAGIAAVVTGRLEAARAIGEYFLHLIGCQPDLERRLYPYYHTSRGLIVDDRVADAPDYFATLDRSLPNQPYWLPGFIMAFLSDLFLSTGDRRYLDGAKLMFVFGEGFHEDFYTNTLNHKYCWGCTRLFRATADHRYLRTALRIADFLVEVQEADGSWWHSGAVPLREQQSQGMTVDATSQFCMWITGALRAASA
jgi:hypothetical protein